MVLNICVNESYKLDGGELWAIENVTASKVTLLREEGNQIERLVLSLKEAQERLSKPPGKTLIL